MRINGKEITIDEGVSMFLSNKVEIQDIRFNSLEEELKFNQEVDESITDYDEYLTKWL